MLDNGQVNKEGSIKKKTLSGIYWSVIERFSLYGVQFVINILMARFLLPSDYGMVGMLAIVLQLSQTLIDSGFGSALTRKIDRTDLDYSTVQCFNIGISIILYAILFLTAPLIAAFYEMPALTQILRVIALTLVIGSVSSVYKVKLTIDLDFKTQSIVTLVSAITSGVIGVFMAYYGYGVWALVAQSILNNLFSTVLYIILAKWYPKLRFSSNSFRTLFSFGSKLMVSSIINTIYRNLYTIVIGKRFSADDLGYYTRSDQFASFPSMNLVQVISRVTYPVLCKFQEDDVKLADIYRKFIRLSSFVIFPLMLGLVALAEPTIIVLLTEKWRPAIILMQILCLDLMLDHITNINLNLLYVKGRSDWALKLEVIKKTIATIILFASIPFGLNGVCWGRVLYSVIATVLNTYYTKRLINMGFIRQLKDFAPYMIASTVMALLVYMSLFLFQSYVAKLFVGLAVGIVAYTLISLVFFKGTVREMVQFIKTK